MPWRRRHFAVTLGAGALACRANPVSSGTATAPPTPTPLAAPQGLRGFCDDVTPIDASEFPQRVRALQDQVAAGGLDGWIGEAGISIAYLTGARWRQNERPFLLWVPASGSPVFVCAAFEEQRAREQIGDAPVIAWQEHEDPFARLHAQHAKARVLLDPGMRTSNADRLLRAGFRRATELPDPVGELRMRKSAGELACLRRANEATKAALDWAMQVVHAGMTEAEVAATVRSAQEAAGLDHVWVLALAGPNAAFPHGTSAPRRLEPGDPILVDTGGFLHGYASDITRTWVVPGAPPNARLRRAWETVHAAQAKAFAAIRRGVTMASVDAEAREHIASAGYPPQYGVFTHRLGHGIGLEVHERPYLRPGNSGKLAAGMTMSVEPGIYEVGHLGVRIEDIVAVTADGHERFGPAAGPLT